MDYEKESYEVCCNLVRKSAALLEGKTPQDIVRIMERVLDKPFVFTFNKSFPERKHEYGARVAAVSGKIVGIVPRSGGFYGAVVDLVTSVTIGGQPVTLELTMRPGSEQLHCELRCAAENAYGTLTLCPPPP